ncbi:FecR family protein [uncultured Parabacteroides sp.]|jgi:ferric-dicitrate binding protein FerR (iron transport regulator)|uniref:FecR family protein n=1 Tax=uncultured Parabacteroides sp. TaxID=512312 RepID=UPI0025EB64F4|nr:FecR family protein [uncultured Parabacteroides sp.]
MSKAYKILHNLVNHTFDPELRSKVWEWIVNPSNQKEKEEALLSLWNEYPQKADMSTYHSLKETRRKIKHNRQQKQLNKITKSLARAAAILFIPLLSVVGSYLYVQKYTSEIELVQCFVPDGEKKEFILPDGSKANVNSGSILIYPKKFKGDTRSIYLSGEANFSVEKDKKRPFIVKTNHIKVQALGTKFNVQAYTESDKIITTLENGSVKVDKTTEDENSFILSPNEQLEYNYRTGAFEKRTINAANYCGWTKGELNFMNQPLKEILATLQREYAVQFVINSRLFTPDLYTIKFSQHESIDNIMNILTLTVGGLKYDIEDNIITIQPLKKKGL